MLLQDIFKEENINLKSIYSIELNEESVKTEYATPPEALENVGFLFKVDQDGMIEENLLDIIISYKLTNLSVVVEVPAQLLVSGEIEPRYLLQLASNVDFSISLLPPGHPKVDSSVTQEQYQKIIDSFTDELLSRQNFDKEIMPITSFFQYVMMEKLLGEDKMKAFKIEDIYVLENFATILSVENSDKFKASIRAKLYDFYGSQENFDSVAQLMFETLYNKAKNVYTGYVRQHVENEKANLDANSNLAQ